MTVFQSLVKKETLHIMHDQRTMAITLVMPLVLLLLFGFAISTEVNDVGVAVVTDRHTQLTRGFIEKLRADEYFNFKGTVSEREAGDMLRRGETDAVVFLRQDGPRLVAHIDVDASNPTVAQASAAYIRSLLSDNAASPFLTAPSTIPSLKAPTTSCPASWG